MSELEDKLSAILGNPQAMGQIMSLAQSLSSGSAAPSSPDQGQAEPEDIQTEPPAPAQAPAPDLSALLSGLTGGSGGIDPRLLTLAARVMNESQSDLDGRAALLQALRPFVKEQRYAKLDKAIQIAKLSRMIRVALDVFKGGGQDNV